MTIDIHQERILILDFGSQYTQLIARRVRELGVYCEIYAYDAPSESIKEFNPAGVILSGGPETVTSDDTPRIDDSVFALNVPLFGICYGMQTLVQQLGGAVSVGAKREFGYAKLNINDKNTLFAEVEHDKLDVWMSHGDKVTRLPDGFTVLASSDNAEYAAIANLDKNYFAVQFHPEVTHTQAGDKLLNYFLTTVCGCQGLWQVDNIIADQVEKIREQVGNEHVVLGLSGGVDSAVVAALVHQAIGDQLTCLFIDTGLLRKDEATEVMREFRDHFHINIKCINAGDEFLTALQGEADPEQKRKITGRKFIEVFEREATACEDATWLAQGTIYPDIIESAASKTGKAHVIKSHHNVGGLPERMHLKLLEPLRELFKDEVRKLGRHLGLPDSILMRHPFPGPGLVVRILGEVKPEYVDLLRAADAIYLEELRAHGLYDEVSQAFAVFLPVKSVGVMGDARKYDYVIALRAVCTVDFMTAHVANLSYEFLTYVASRIVNEIPGISRVTYDISGKPPATIEWE